MCEDNLNILKEKIEGLRRELCELYQKKGKENKELVEKSRELDKLIVEYTKRVQKKKKKAVEDKEVAAG